MGNRYRVRADFDVVVPTGNEQAATQLGETHLHNIVEHLEKRGDRIETGGVSPEVAAKGLLENPLSRATVLAMAILLRGNEQDPIHVENISLQPLSQAEEE